MLEYVLTLSDLVGDPESISESDRQCIESALEALDAINDRDRSRAVRVRNAAGATATVQALLAPHWRHRTTGYCAGCPQEVEPAWPCPAWRAAHRWLVELDPTTGNRYDDEWHYMPPTS